MRHPLRLSARQSTQAQERLRLRPAARPVLYQDWHDLLFLHWPVPPGQIQPHLPDTLTVDCFDQKAWIGIVPFRMSGVRPRGLPTVPGLSGFAELNLRTYVRDAEGAPGVWFFSLDAEHWLPVWIARTFFNLPYHTARMRVRHDSREGWIHFDSRRRGHSALTASHFTYRGRGQAEPARPGCIEFFLTERYTLFTTNRAGELLHGRIHHPPYALEAVEVSRWDSRLFEFSGFRQPGTAYSHACYSRGVRVEIFPLQQGSPFGEPHPGSGRPGGWGE